MLHIRHLVGRTILRALFLIATVSLAAGSIVLDARAEPAVSVQVTGTGVVYATDRLSVEVFGAGPDVILIPGFGSSREVWRPLAERLAATHRVHLVQLAGFAGEPWVHGDATFIQPMVDALAAYVSQAQLSRPVIIGHSMGGLGALLLAQQYPERVGRVMSVDSLPFFSALFGPQVTAQSAQPFADQAAAGILSADDATFRASQQQAAQGYSKDPATQAAMMEWSLASDRRAMATAIREVMTTDARPGLSAMTTPVWAIYASDANGGAPAALADAVWEREYASLPGVVLIRVDASRHFIMADQPGHFAEIVDQFLAD